MLKFLLTILIIVSAVYFVFYGGEKKNIFIGDLIETNPLDETGTKITDTYYSSKSRFLKEIGGVKYGKEDKKEEGERYFAGAERAADQISEPEAKVRAFIDIAEKRIEADKDTMKEKIMENFQKAQELVDMMPPEKKEILAEPLAKAEAPLENPLMIFRALESAPSQTRSSALFNIAQGYLKENNISLAQEVASSIEDERYKSAFLIMVIDNIAEMDDIKSAGEEASKIQDPIFRTYGFLKILRSLVEKEKLEEAENFALESSDDLFKNMGLLEVANIYINIKNFDEAYRLLLLIAK